MSSSSVSASVLVARFLRSNNYPQTLSAFLQEAGLPKDAGAVAPGKDGADTWDIENILREKKEFDKSVSFERVGGPEDKNKQWTLPAPSFPKALDTPSSANILSISVVPKGHSLGEGVDDDENVGSYSLAVTSADKRLSFMDISDERKITTSLDSISQSPILSVVPFQDGLGRKCLAMTNIAGRLITVHGSGVLSSRQDHAKYAIQVVSSDTGNGDDESSGNKQRWLATAGWDKMVFIYHLDSTASQIGEPLDSIELPTNPQCIQFIRNQETDELILLVSREDSTNLFYYLIEPGNPAGSCPVWNDASYKCQYLGKQNLAPHANAWVSFSPFSFAICPRDPQLLAVATSSLPHMKVMIVKLLIPSTPPSLSSSSPQTTQDQDQHETQARQALAELAIQNREDAAILINANTMAPQTSYSTPTVVWRPDGSGVWVNGDDGVIRGVEASTGKVVATLNNGHEPGSKVRSIWAGWVTVRERGECVAKEWLVSGGFDKKLLAWEIQQP